MRRTPGAQLTSRRALALAVVLGLILTAALAAFGWPAIAYRDNDFASLWVMGRMLLDGGDQYDYATYVAAHRAIGSRALTIVLPDTASFYPLTTALVFAPFALLPIPIAAPLWFASQVVIGSSALVALASRLFPATLRRDLPLLLAFAWSCQPAWVLAEGGNMGGFLVGIAASSATFLLAGRPVLAGAVAGLLVVKPHPLFIALPLVLLAVPRPVAARMLGSALAVAGAIVTVTLVLRPGWIGEMLAQLGRVSTYAVRVRQATLFGLLGADFVWLAWVVVIAIVAASILWARTRPPLPLVIGAAVAVSLLTVPYGFSYDHVLLLVSVTAAIAVVSHAPSGMRAGMLVLLASAFIALPWVLYALAYRRGDESLNALTPLAILGVLVLAARLTPTRVSGSATS